MKIKDFAQIIGISEYTIRFYEKIGVLKPIKRNSSGYREFLDNDIIWMQFVIRLKNTGMPIDKIIEYAHLRDIGDSTKQDRIKLLEEHERNVLAEIESKKLNLKKIQEKIIFYKNS